MQKLLNYIGQLRIYSLVDLMILIVAVEATIWKFVGVLFLHVGFLAYLESKHAHDGRATVPKWLWLFLVAVGLFLYQRLEIVPFLLASFFYTKKNNGGHWAIWSPFCRGLQYFFLLAGISGYGNYLPWIAFFLIAIRNMIGDLRDVEKDKVGGMMTLPILFGFGKDIRYGHLVAVIVSTIIWWSCAYLPLSVLFCVIAIEIVTYDLTPR